jgi:dCTP deaminase
MMLSGFDIEHLVKTGRLSVRPFSKGSVRENGIDFRLANEIARHPLFKEGFVLDPSNPAHISSSYKIEKGKGRMVIRAHEQVLLSTLEFIEVPDDIAGFVELRSTWARHGLSMPPTIIDAGFAGNITLEVVNNAPYDIALKSRIPFAHIVFNKLNNKASDPYKGTYYGQKGIRLPKPIR